MGWDGIACGGGIVCRGGWGGIVCGGWMEWDSVRGWDGVGWGC